MNPIQPTLFSPAEKHRLHTHLDTAAQNHLIQQLLHAISKHTQLPKQSPPMALSKTAEALIERLTRENLPENEKTQALRTLQAQKNAICKQYSHLHHACTIKEALLCIQKSTLPFQQKIGELGAIQWLIDQQIELQGGSAIEQVATILKPETFAHVFILRNGGINLGGSAIAQALINHPALSFSEREKTYLNQLIPHLNPHTPCFYILQSPCAPCPLIRSHISHPTDIKNLILNALFHYYTHPTALYFILAHPDCVLHFFRNLLMYGSIGDFHLSESVLQEGLAPLFEKYVEQIEQQQVIRNMSEEEYFNSLEYYLHKKDVQPALVSVSSLNFLYKLNRIAQGKQHLLLRGPDLSFLFQGPFFKAPIERFHERLMDEVMRPLGDYLRSEFDQDGLMRLLSKCYPDYIRRYKDWEKRGRLKRSNCAITLNRAGFHHIVDAELSKVPPIHVDLHRFGIRFSETLPLYPFVIAKRVLYLLEQTKQPPIDLWTLTHQIEKSLRMPITLPIGESAEGTIVAKYHYGTRQIALYWVNNLELIPIDFERFKHLQVVGTISPEPLSDF